MFKKAIFLFILSLLSFMYSNAQSMTSRNLLDNLAPHWVFLEDLREELFASTKMEYVAVLEQAYSFIQLELRDEDGQLFLQIKYQMRSENSLSLYSFYCDNKNMATQLEDQAKKQLENFEWKVPSKSKFQLSNNQIQYLEIADRIATFGDDISTNPSFYTKLLLTANVIQLEQINRRNSRSIDHKNSYFLRDLYFVIPLKDANEGKKASKIGAHFIGDLEIRFQDSSAKSQRATGDKIMLQIKEEVKNYN